MMSLTPAMLLLTVAVIFGVTMLFVIWRLLDHPRHQRQEERSILDVIVQLVDQDLPLATALPVAALSESFRLRRFLRKIAARLQPGAPLSGALRAGYPLCSGQTTALILAGERAGRLGESVRHARRLLDRREEQSQTIAAGIPAYALVVIVLTLTAVSFLMIVVVPKYAEILADCDASPPAATVLMARTARAVVSIWPFVVLTLLLVVPLLSHLRAKPRRPDRLELRSRAADWLLWHVPGVRRLEYRGGMAQMLAFLRDALSTGMPLADAATLTAGLDVNVALRQRMSTFAAAVRTGSPACRAARQSGLGEVAASALSGRGRAGVDAGLRFAADYYAGLLARSWLVVRSVAMPTVVLTLGFLVGGVVYALFAPLVVLIEAACRW